MTRRDWIWLALITAAAAVLRFAWLDRPCLWGDEALVYWRTCGTYAELLAVLRTDGFPPLHYELYWLIVRLVGGVPGPAAMRAVPAACGTLLVPAVYFVARQLLSRRASVVAAMLTAGSAFGLFYSRDAKMYAEAWLAMTAAVGCLLAWLRTGRLTWWLAWVAAATLAAGFQSLTLVSTVGLSPLLLLSGRRVHWRQSLAWVGGVALIAVGPAGYYLAFNTWTDRVESRGWSESGLAWIQFYNFGRNGPSQAGYLATTFLTGWEWPNPAIGRPLPAGRMRLLTAAVVGVTTVLAAGLLPWPRRWAGVETTDSIEPPWRAGLWLTAWIGLPTYVFYCRSVQGFAAPLDWLTAAGLLAHPRGWAAAAALAAAAVVASLIHPATRTVARRWLSVAAAVVSVAVVCQAIAMGLRPLAAAAQAAGRPWQSVWVPRYLGFVWPAVVIACGALLARLPTAGVRWSAVGLVLAVNVGLFAFRLFGSTEPPVDRIAADVWSAQGDGADTLVWTAFPDYRDWQAGPTAGQLYTDPGRYYLQRLAHRPMAPALFKRSLSTFTLHNGDDAADDVPPLIHAGVRRLVVWELLPAVGPLPSSDRLAKHLVGWRSTSDELITIREVWTTRDAARYRRRTYARSE